MISQNKCSYFGFSLAQLQFFFSPGFLDSMDVMLDDISFESCGEEDIPDGLDRLSCDFEKDTCSWYHDYTASLKWKRTNGRYEDITGNGENPVHMEFLLVELSPNVWIQLK